VNPSSSFVSASRQRKQAADRFLCPDEPDVELHQSETAVRCLDLARQFVTHVLASGVLGRSRVEDGYHNAITCRSTREKQQLAENESENGRLSHMAFDDGSAGYLLGIAVGQQRGPDAFRVGGAR
jgi:hypothetical protein